MSQRGIRPDDLELAELIGTAVESGCLVRQKDAQTAVRELKRLIHQIERLPGKRVVQAADAVITAYHASRPRERRLLRRA